jgi:murein DD-endopeptidase MepM/ murein hydrolase activator NlpD
VNGRGIVRAVVTALCAVAVLTPAAVGSAAPSDDLATVQRELEQARDALAGAEGRRGVTLADLRRVDARRQQVARELEALEGQLAGAEQALSAAQDALTATTRELLASERALDAARAELDGERDAFARRVRASYKHGGVDVGAAVFEVRDVNELTRSLKYVGAVLEDDRAQVEVVAALERDVARALDELGQLRDRQAAERAAAAGERDRVFTLVAQQHDLERAAAAEAELHGGVLAAIEADAGAHRALIASLEAESARLEAELRRRAEAARLAAAREAEAARRGTAATSRSVTVAPGGGGGSTPPGLPGGGGGSRPPGLPARLAWPADGPQTSGFGLRSHPIFGDERMHAGIDIVGPTGAPIYAADDGVVVSAGWRGGYGNATVIDHGDGLATLYAHQSRLGVVPGERVERGQVIGMIGSSGFSTGPHLHFEVRVDGQPVNPAGWF